MGIKDIDTGEIVADLRKNAGELTAGFTVLIIALLLVYVKKSIIISLIAAAAILVIGIEKRARAYDRILAISAVFLLCLIFIILG